MAENNSYHIYIHLDDFANESAVANPGTGSTGIDAPSSGDAASDKFVSKAKKMVSFAAVASSADKLISYNISQVNLQTGATEYEQRLNAAYSLGKQFVGAGAALIGGALMGGPAGFAVAAIGIVSSGINQLISYEQRKQTLQTQQSLENITIGMQNVRAGTTGRRSKEQ